MTWEKLIPCRLPAEPRTPLTHDEQRPDVRLHHAEESTMGMTTRKGIGGHSRPNRGASDDYITPPAIRDALGVFDLDPCASMTQPWPMARFSITEAEDGLAADWFGRVWLNPPYSQLDAWLSRLADHGDGIALAFARTETATFQRHVWRRASGVLFLDGRLHFHTPAGERLPYNAGAPSALIAYGPDNLRALLASGLPGAVVKCVAFLGEHDRSRTVTAATSNAIPPAVRCTACGGLLTPLVDHAFCVRCNGRMVQLGPSTLDWLRRLDDITYEQARATFQLELRKQAQPATPDERSA